uniref:LOW QUALITY PROTEIN: cadherin-24-like n=1 Tax=Podarcis muralis TaxID=64176 RepID=UPI0010A082EE|nr:LOW QUALITY PROTEIN: cadherin-24-like [Podarcis muralis]
MATVRITVEDADEPPAFSRSDYHLAVYENSPPGTLLGKVTAVDLDSPSSAIRYSILPHTDPERYFSINPQDGTILTSVPLDRELLPWHNMTVVATELDSPTQASHVQVAIQILDVNDNPPQLEHSYEPFVCDNAAPGHLVQLIRAVDRDEDGNVSRIIIRSPLGARDPNVTVRDNKDNSASLLLRAARLPTQGGSLLVPLELVDGGSPTRTGSPTLTVSICRCRRDGAMHSCGAEALGSPAGLSTGALLAILACVGTLLALVLLFVALRRAKQAALLPFEEEDVRENIITYDDEGGGEEDTEAFDMAALQNPDAAPPPPQQRRLFRRDVLPRLHFPPSLPTRLPPQPHDVASFLAARLSEVDADPSVPPYDSIQVYGYEGQGSSAGSLSSPGSSCAGDSDAGGYEYLEEWGPLFRTLAELYGTPRRATSNLRDFEPGRGHIHRTARPSSPLCPCRVACCFLPFGLLSVSACLLDISCPCLRRLPVGRGGWSVAFQIFLSHISPTRHGRQSGMMGGAVIVQHLQGHRLATPIILSVRLSFSRGFPAPPNLSCLNYFDFISDSSLPFFSYFALPASAIPYSVPLDVLDSLSILLLCHLFSL